MSFNVFSCKCAGANLILKADFKLINRTDLFICLHVMFQISFQILRGKKVIAGFWVFGQNFCSVYVSCSGSITLVGEERANLPAFVYL